LRTFGRPQAKLPKSGFGPDLLDVLERSGRNGYWHLDLKTEDIFFSQEVCRAHGMPNGYIPQTIDECVAWYHPDDQYRVSEIVKQSLRDGHPFCYEARLVAATQEIRWVSVTGEIRRDEHGEAVTVVGALSDITEAREANLQLTEALREAHSANRLKDSFLANMSHELRTPLNAIIGFSQLIEMMEASGRVDEQVADYASDITNAGEHLLSIIEDLFRVAQLEADTSKVNFETVPVGSLLDDVSVLTNAAAKAQGRTVVLEGTPCARTSIVGDKDKLVKVLVNLVSNAIKFSPVSSVVRIIAECERDSHVLIKVTDTGRGIPEALHHKIFERFERLEASKYAVEGIGVGLAIARDLVTSMGGKIGVDSAIGKGSTFWIRFPVQQQSTVSLVG